MLAKVGLVVALTVLLMPTAPAEPPEQEEIQFFEREVRPLLLEKCVSCHGPEKQQSGLRLDSRDALLKGGLSGPAAIAGDAAGSLLIQAVHQSGELKMPRGGKLSDAEVAALEQWVNAGLPWPASAAAPAPLSMDERIEQARATHWSFQPLVAPPAPQVPGAATPVDAFILEKLTAEGLAPAAPATKRDLLRRATFDLTGLPPTPEDLAAFEADTAPDAFAHVVDRLLASPQYGERWARHWLDVVRYTDSVDSRATYEQDLAEAWKYRDWVVKSLNEDLPYDQFIRYQIAGDLIPSPAGEDFHPEGIIATAMLAIGNFPWGDADKEKMVTDIVDDQIDVVTRGIMGVTVACARCHDHKFDPFTTRDYYALAGVFFSTHVMPEVGPKSAGSPVLHIPLESPEIRAERAAHAQALTDAETKVQALFAENRQQALAAGLEKTADYLLAAREWNQAPPSNGIETASMTRGLNAGAVRRWMNVLGLLPYRLMTRPVASVHGKAGLYAVFGKEDTPSVVVNTTGDQQSFLSITQQARSVVLHPGPTSAVAAAWRSAVAGPVSVIARVADADATCGEGIAWRLERRSGESVEVLMQGLMPNGGTQLINGAEGGDALNMVNVRAEDFLALIIDPNAGHACDSTTVEFQITELNGAQRIWNVSEDAIARFTQSSNPLPDTYGRSAAWEFWDLAGPAEPLDLPELTAWRGLPVEAESGAVQEAAAQVKLALNKSVQDNTDRTPTPPATLLAFLQGEQSPYYGAAGALPVEKQEELQALETSLAQLRARSFPAVEFANGVQDGGVPKTTYEGTQDVAVHIRGDYNRLGDVVPRGYPVVLAKESRMDPAGESGRRQLAEWITRPDHPLTPRVMVNRLWLHHFGQGLVRTPGDFGMRGEKPTHPELLDYLAAEFIRSGWSLKAMHRLIMLSDTYQRSTAISPEAHAKDVDNRLWSHANRQRLEAESLRDAMLFVAGELESTLGGPPFIDLATPRRTLYFKTVRSDRTSYTMLFDAADPTSIIAQRQESLVAPQALFLMNNPFVLKASELLAQRLAETPLPDDAPRLDWLFQRLYNRLPTAQEREISLALLHDEPSGATAWTALCQTLLASNEFLFVE